MTSAHQHADGPGPARPITCRRCGAQLVLNQVIDHMENGHRPPEAEPIPPAPWSDA